jgi:hypothetical protein
MVRVLVTVELAPEQVKKVLAPAVVVQVAKVVAS